MKFNRNKEFQAKFMKYTFLLHTCLVLQISIIIKEQADPCGFPNQWKQTAIVPVFKKANINSVSNYKLIYILNKCSKLFEFVIYDV
jgi:hypothetical protein